MFTIPPLFLNKIKSKLIVFLHDQDKVQNGSISESNFKEKRVQMVKNGINKEICEEKKSFLSMVKNPNATFMMN